MEAADFYLATAGAAAALAGLVIVALSVTVDRVIGIPGMTSRAAATIALLIGTTIVALAGLLPQPTIWFAVEVALIALALLAFSTDATVKARHGSVGAGARAAIAFVPAVLLAIAAALLFADPAVAVPLIGLSALTAILVAIVNTWVVLVELKR